MENKNYLDITFDTRWLALKAEYESNPVLLCKKLFGIDLLPDQAAFVRNIREYATFVTHNSGSGFHTALAVQVVFRIVFEPHRPVVLYSPKNGTDKRIYLLISELLAGFNRAHPWLSNYFRVLKDGFFHLRGNHREGVSFKEAQEWETIGHPSYPAGVVMILLDARSATDRMTGQVLGSLYESGSQVIFASHPGEEESRARSIATNDNGMFKNVKFPALNNPLMSKLYVDHLLTRYPVDSKEYRMRFLAEW